VDEWDKLAKWIINNDLFSHNVRWLIQVPRLYQVYKETGAINTFEEIVISMSLSHNFIRFDNVL
jgi:AMP deaminase